MKTTCFPKTPARLPWRARLLSLLLVAVLCGVAAAQQRPLTATSPDGLPDLNATPEQLGVKSQPPATSVFSERSPRYLLRPGDSVDLSFEFSPEFNQPDVQVQPDGFVTLKGIGDVEVKGMTVPELRTRIESAYSAILNSPKITVVLKQFEAPYIIVNGAVGAPGKYPLRGSTTLAEAIAVAGGFNQFSKHSQVVLFRRANEDWLESKVVDVKAMLNARNLSEDVTLMPGDMVYVPENFMGRIRRFIPRPTIGLP